LAFLRLFEAHGFHPQKQVPVAPNPGEPPISIADFAVPEQRLPTLASGDCAVAFASAENALDVLHAARLRCPRRLAGLAESVNGRTNSKYAPQASLALLEVAQRRWDELSEDQHVTVLALPIHRLADGTFVSLCDVDDAD
jgi:hypothetical protein